MKTFEVKEEHIKLLRSAYTSWDDCEFGAPAIDCKRSYGNSDVLGDMAEILNISLTGRRGRRKTPNRRARKIFIKFAQRNRSSLTNISSYRRNEGWNI